MTVTTAPLNRTTLSLVLVIAASSILGCAGPMPPMHPTARLARLEAQHGQRIARRGTPEAQCEAADALERSAALYEQAQWARRAQEVRQAATMTRQQCPARAPQAAALAPAPAAQPPTVLPDSAAIPNASPESATAAAVVTETSTAGAAGAPTSPSPEAPGAASAPAPTPEVASAPAPTPEVASAPAPAPETQQEPMQMQVSADPAFYQHLQQARAAHDAARHTDALRHLLAAWHIQEEPAVLFNIAVCYENLEQFQQAIQLYQRLTEHPQLGSMANQRIQALSQRTER